jgi:hypothetical protein
MEQPSDHLVTENVQFSGIMPFTNFVRRCRRFSQMNKQTSERFPASPRPPPSQRVKAPLWRGNSCVSVVGNFPPHFIKITDLLAFQQIRRGNEVQPFVCLLLPFFFPVA